MNGWELFNKYVEDFFIQDIRVVREFRRAQQYRIGGSHRFFPRIKELYAAWGNIKNLILTSKRFF